MPDVWILHKVTTAAAAWNCRFCSSTLTAPTDRTFATKSNTQNKVTWARQHVWLTRTLLYVGICPIPMRTEMGPKFCLCSILMRMESAKFCWMSDPNRVRKWLVGSNVRFQIRTFVHDCWVSSSTILQIPRTHILFSLASSSADISVQSLRSSDGHPLSILTLDTSYSANLFNLFREEYSAL